MEATDSCCGGTGEALIFTCAGAAYSGQGANRAGVELATDRLRRCRPTPIGLSAVLLVGLAPLLVQEEPSACSLPSGEWLGRKPFLVALSEIGLGIIGLWPAGGLTLPQEAGRRGPLLPAARRLLSSSLAVAVLSGFLMQLGIASLGGVAGHAYTLFDAALAIVLSAVAIRLISPDPVVAPAASRILSRRITLDSSWVSPVAGGGK